MNKLYAIEYKGVNKWKGTVLFTVAAKDKVSALTVLSNYLNCTHWYKDRTVYKGTGARYLQGVTELPECVVTVHDFLERV